MTFEFETTAPVDAYLTVDLRTLAAMLHLPKGVQIVGVRHNPINARSCLIDIRGELPRSGELVALYTTMDTTVVTFDGFVSP